MLRCAALGLASALLALVTSRHAAADPAPATAAAASTDEAPPPDAPRDANEPVRRTRDASLGRIFRGPFQSSRLYTMPAADTVGAYVLSISGDGSLLQDPGVLTSAGVLAIGFGDIAQLEYRHTSAISVTGINAPVPAVGVQLKIPIPEYPNVPAFGVAFRLGVPRTETFGATAVDETVHDLFVVGRLRFEAAKWLTLHGGVRVSSANIELSGDRTFKTNKRLVLPTGAYELAMNPQAKIVGEISLAPRFSWMPGTEVDPSIGYGLLGRFGMRWNLLPSVILDGSIGYQLDVATNAPDEGPGAIVTWDIRLGAEVFVPWGALACRAAGVFCD
ncbi:MAG TPA: hypothetical protein VFQ53_06200 [Kofleriaceae bacterium]|nr:hypothetical protein [Kofleriaceae bacterium]